MLCQMINYGIVSSEMMMRMRSVFVGRFQPIHKGHLYTVNQILEKDEELVIAIGSAQHSHTPNNPFSGGERVMQIKRALLDEKLPMDTIDVIPVPDINIHPLWIAHLSSLVPYFEKVYSHNPLVRRLVRDADITVGQTELLDRSEYSGKHIRRLIRQENPEWKSLVPEGVIAIIEEHNMDERIRQIGEVTLKK
ncbi:MAG: nicotinamide-nucleotide adenylyltransferase [Candidatus Lokiarchaeota archaeon]|nr:nicotinamide-nucleotide adenylyltransferase [Candidatus Lokiarchaeota archaeon]